VCSSDLAQIILQRSLNISGSGTLKLPWAYCLLECMDLVTITDAALGFQKLPVRITAIGENEEGDLELEIEDWPLGSAHATLYPSQISSGFQHNYNVAPGAVSAPVFLEAPVERTTTGLEVYAAVKGGGVNWGGCNVWVSLDGTTYRRVATVNGAARYGTITGPVSGGALPVSTSGQLVNASAADAAALSSLCWVGGATPEYLAYTTATLTGAGAYTLGGLVRGGFGSSAAAAHTTGDPFVRVDDALARSGSLDLGYIGKTIYFKFTSFNLYGAAEESLATVTAYTYTITGNMAALPPSTPTGLAYAAEPFGIRLSCAKNPEPDVVGYEWRTGSTWASATPLEKHGGTSYLWAVQFAGSATVWVAAVDALGNLSTPASMVVTVSAGSLSSFTATLAGTDMQLDYAGVAGAFAIDGYEIRYGDTFATATVVGYFKITRHVRRVDWGGARRWWGVPVDVKGNYGTPTSVDTVVTIPGPVTSTRADVVDNNALLYWSAPATGSLPIDRYEVRKGASWAAGTVVGSNGNSTFTTVFEQQSGTYSYWVAPWDSAGNMGTPVAIPATIAQPPDYILRTQINSSFAGTLTGMYVENGALIGPANTTETFAQHFANNAWASPQDQINAGYPLYIEPSAASGSYDETFDYGAVLPATTITLTLGTTPIVGTVATSVQIYYKTALGDAWTAAAAGAYSVLANNFRYVRVVVTFAGVAGANLISLNSLTLKLANKLKTDSGAGTAAVGGSVVSFNVAFVSADTPLVQPAGSTPLIPVVIYSGGANPTGFTVRLYNTSGADVGGTFSWTARGY
jgi:hypothetical protein